MPGDLQAWHVALSWSSSQNSKQAHPQPSQTASHVHDEATELSYGDPVHSQWSQERASACPKQALAGAQLGEWASGACTGWICSNCRPSLKNQPALQTLSQAWSSSWAPSLPSWDGKWGCVNISLPLFSFIKEGRMKRRKNELHRLVSVWGRCLGTSLLGIPCSLKILVGTLARCAPGISHI